MEHESIELSDEEQWAFSGIWANFESSMPGGDATSLPGQPLDEPAASECWPSFGDHPRTGNARWFAGGVAAGGGAIGLCSLVVAPAALGPAGVALAVGSALTFVVRPVLRRVRGVEEP